MPNRTLEEFNHFPMVRTADPRGPLVPVKADPRWEWNGNTADTVGYAKHLHRTLRQTLGPKNPIRWDDEAKGVSSSSSRPRSPTATSSTSTETIKADGCSMGDLLFSLPLGARAEGSSLFMTGTA